jgi:hypothetical protein
MGKRLGALRWLGMVAESGHGAEGHRWTRLLLPVILVCSLAVAGTAAVDWWARALVVLAGAVVGGVVSAVLDRHETKRSAS